MMESSFNSEYNINMAAFFWLNMPESILVEILKEAGFTEIRKPPQTIDIFPGVKLRMGPPTVPLARFKSITAEYNSEKFMLGLKGLISDVREILEPLAKAFEKFNYSLDSIIKYYEITFPPQPLNVEHGVSALRRNIKLAKPLKLFNENLNIFTISFSNTTSPIGPENFNRWFHIRLEPDVQNTEKRLYLHIIKREKEFKKCLKFLDQIETVLKNIKEFLEGD